MNRTKERGCHVTMGNVDPCFAANEQGMIQLVHSGLIFAHPPQDVAAKCGMNIGHH